ncbi:MAG: PilW family protein [Candidatus Competibacterales bacterium]
MDPLFPRPSPSGCRRGINPRRRCRGTTLPELLVSFVISLIILAGIVQVYSLSKSAYNTQSALSEIQNTARFAFELLGYQFRMVGYLGCGQNRSLSLDNLLVNSGGSLVGDNFPYDFENVLWGYDKDSNALPAPHVGFGSRVASDWVSFKMPANNGVVLVSGMGDATDTSFTVRPLGSDEIDPGKSIIISDCQRLRVVRSATYGSGTPNSTLTRAANPSDIGYVFGQGSNIYPIQTVAYYVDVDPTDGPRLMRKVHDDTASPYTAAQALFDGVEHFEILYGVDTNPATNTPEQADIYVDATEVAASHSFDDVVSVRVGMIVRSKEPVGAENPTPIALFKGAGTYEISVAIPDDKRLRKSFEMSFSLRNRIL